MSLVAALILDALAGEPRTIWDRVPHPAVLMGRAVGWCDARMNRGGARRIRGVLAIALLSVGAALTGGAIAALPGGTLWGILAAAILLAQRSLVQHVAAVATALRRDIGAGRRSVAMIVGRDTGAMDPPAVARAAIEFAAENLSDGVVAPALWFAVAGLPGMAAYKMVNTADSMIGHRTPRHGDFGWAAARLDDAMNWIPARITAALILAVNAAPHHWGAVAQDARQHRSPNAGWPEAAMARVLDVALSGPRAYAGRTGDFPFVHPDGRRAIGADEIDAACTVLWRAWAGLLAGAAAWSVAVHLA